MILNKLIATFTKNSVPKKSTELTPKEMLKENRELMNKTMQDVSSKAIANTAMGSFQAMQNLQDLNRQLREQLANNQQQQEENK